MATTKALSAIWSSHTLTAGAGGRSTCTALTLDDGYGASLHIKLTNGGTGPTLPAQVEVQTSADDSEYYTLATLKAGVTSSTAYSWGGITIDMGVEYVRLIASSNTGQAVYIDADLSEVTAIS